MAMGSPGFLCLYSRCRSNSDISAPIIKNILLLAVDAGRSRICGRNLCVRMNATLKKGMLRSFTTHTFDDFIGFGCEDEDN